MTPENRNSAIAAAILLAIFGLGAFYLPTIIERRGAIGEGRRGREAPHVGLDQASGLVQQVGLQGQRRRLFSVRVHDRTRLAVRSGSQDGSRFAILHLTRSNAVEHRSDTGC